MWLLLLTFRVQLKLSANFAGSWTLVGHAPCPAAAATTWGPTLLSDDEPQRGFDVEAGSNLSLEAGQQAHLVAD